MYDLDEEEKKDENTNEDGQFEQGVDVPAEENENEKIDENDEDYQLRNFFKASQTTAGD